LVASGIIGSADDPTHKQKTVYSLTEMGIALVPPLVNLGSWGRTFLPASDELSIRIEFLERGGPSLWDEFMDELRETHVGTPQPPRQGATVRERLDTAYNSLAHD
jgi:hypothetical protein